MQYQPLSRFPGSDDAAPLAGCTILVTRAAHQAAQFSQALKHTGADVIELPLIEILPPVSWAQFDKTFSNIEKYNWLLFASANAVKFTTARLEQIGKVAAARSQLAVAAIGDATMQAARACGFNVVFYPSEFEGTALVQQFSDYLDLGGAANPGGAKRGSAKPGGDIKIIWPRTDIGPKNIEDELCKSGMQIDTITCYRTALPENCSRVAEKLAALLLANSVDVITFNNAQTVRNFCLLLKQGLDSPPTTPAVAEPAVAQASVDLQTLLAPITIASIGPQTSAVIRQLLGRVDIEARTHTVAGLVEELMCCLGSQRQARI